MKHAALVLILLLLAGALAARGGDGGDYSGDSGGGGSSSGGSSDYSSSSSDYSSSGGGGGGGDSPLGLVFGLAVIGIVVFAALMNSRKNRQTIEALRKTGHVTNQPSRAALDLVRNADPNFSPVLFRAFAHLVYVKYHESTGERDRSDYAVAPYIHPKLREALRKTKQAVKRVIVGNLRILNAQVTATGSRIEVQFKANIVYGGPGNSERRMLASEQFTFERRAGALTREPDRVLALGCPACGSRTEPDVIGRCEQCGQHVGRGQLDWQVRHVHSRPQVPVNEPVGRGGGVEVGTDRSTVIDGKFQANERALRMRDPEFSWPEFRLRCTTIFTKLQEGWTHRDEGILRPYELDHVYDSHRIWLERYREQGVRNVLEDITVDKWEAVKIETDTWFDAITVRIFASMIDYNLGKDGTLISGSKSKRKSFSEYFTLVRRTAHKARISADPLRCPQCGAPLDKVTQVGICGYCDSRITTGDFDWVLALITQDEEYQG